MIPAPPHTFAKRLVARNPAKWEHDRLLGWTKEGNEIIATNPHIDFETVAGVLPAAPGWYALKWYGDDPADEPTADWRLTKVPIIAWVVMQQSTLYNGKADMYTSLAGQRADGETHASGNDMLGPDGLVYAYETEPILFANWLQNVRERTTAAGQKEKA